MKIDEKTTIPLKLLYIILTATVTGAWWAFSMGQDVKTLKADMYLIKKHLHIEDAETVAGKPLFLENAEARSSEGRHDEKDQRTSDSRF